jgi:transposase
MYASPHLPSPSMLGQLQLTIVPDLIEIRVRCASAATTCPICGQPSTRVHSRYTRTLADLPWHGTPVNLELQARRLFCDTPDCPRRIFTERLPGVAGAYARKTLRLVGTLGEIGFAMGGEPGSRLARRLGMPVSGDTLLRTIRQAPTPAVPPTRVLGVDDWAWRRGRTYGTILCDLEEHRPVDLLPERSAETLSAWLRAHPEPEIISRDRAGCYAQGASAGAPQAKQVADRWHLLHNLRDALKRLADRHHHDLRGAAAQVSARAPPQQPPKAEVTTESLTSEQRQQKERRAHRHERYERVIELHKRGVSQRSIGRQLGLNRETVRRFVRAGTFPERATRTYSTLADPFTDYIRQRWEEGCHNAAQISRELMANGFEGSYYVIRRRVARWRGETSDARLPVDRSVSRQPSARRVAGLLLSDPNDLSEDELAFVKALTDRCPAFRVTGELGREFVAMTRAHKAEELAAWIEKVCQAGVPPDLRTFAEGLRSDSEAVEAAMSMEWSNGQVEGQVNRLKLIKRQMYGRAGFDLLRQRVLHHE